LEIAAVKQQQQQQQQQKQKQEVPTTKAAAASAAVVVEKVLSFTTNDRVFVDRSKALELLADKKDTDYTVVKISGMSIGRDAAKVFAEKLVTLDKVHSLDLSDCIAGRKEDVSVNQTTNMEKKEISEERNTIVIMMMMMTVDFLKTFSQEALEVLTTLSGSFKNKKNLIEISLSNNALGRKGIDACKELLNGQKQLQRL
jgi:Ran GTPase-activating protein (RanGAP) involved in mRNA processing and transport